MNQTVVEHRCDGFAQPIQEFHLDAQSSFCWGAFQPDGLLLVDQNTVAIQAQPQLPALVTLPQVLQGGIPNQPVQQQGLAAAPGRGSNGNKPRGVLIRLGPRQWLPAVQLPGDRSAWRGDRFAPGVSGPGAEAMAARAQLRELEAEDSVIALKQSKRCLIVDLQHHMGPDAEVWAVGEGPVRNLDCQLQLICVHDAPVGRGDQLQLWTVFVQSPAQLLNATGRRHLLQSSTA